MKRSVMLCSTCIKMDGDVCRLGPAPLEIEEPGKHWCAQGVWHQWSERYQEMEPFYWGEWEEVV
ncbi:MAG: hypothetical protein HY914_05100 [Desulfomonile tiedjei]|nr:hypothetical protein [Desulfomonile tiedjei]